MPVQTLRQHLVEIPKSDGGVRLLGIPTVTDRLIQQAIFQVLSKIYDPMFSEHSYGFCIIIKWISLLRDIHFISLPIFPFKTRL
jgi:hypothetical protein